MAGNTEREPDAYRRLRLPKTTAAERAERDEKIWRGWVSGKNERVLAFEFDISVRLVRRIISDHKKLVAESAPSVEDFRTMIVEGTRDVIATMTTLMHADPSPAYSNGKPILDAYGEQALDYTIRLNAADRVLRAYERLGKITGVEAPDTSQVSITVAAQSDAERAAQEALARLMAAANLPALTATREESETPSAATVFKTAPGVPVTAEVLDDMATGMTYAIPVGHDGAEG